jgi:hypothetical protein
MRWVLLALLSATLAHGQLVQEIIANSGGTSIPGPFNYNVQDWSGGCTNGNAPTTTQLNNGTQPSLPSGMTYTVTNTNTDVKCNTSEYFNWPTFTLTGGAWANTSAISLALTLGTSGDGIHYNYPSSGQAQVSNCVPVYTNWPQSVGLTSRVDLWDLDSLGSPFINGELQGTAAPALNMLTECGGSPTGGNCPSGEGTNGVFPTSTWQIMCHYINAGTGTIGEYQAMWDPPVGARCNGSTCSNDDGLLVSNTLISATGITGGTTVYTEEFQIGTNGGNSGSLVFSGPEVGCGWQSGSTNCPFPVGPGLQLIAPSASPGSGNYTSAQTVTLSDISNAVSIYYTVCSMAGCTPATPTTSSTLYSGTITATPPEAISAIAALTSYISSPSVQFDYVSPNATYVSSGQAESATTTAAITGLSIPSGDLIICWNANSANGITGCTDSNSDTPHCASIVTATTNGNTAQGCLMVAGTTVTSVTCAQTFTHTMNCLAAWYTPGTLTGALDQATGQDNPSVEAWSSGNTSALSGSADLVVGFTSSSFAHSSYTNTPSDGGTQRLTCSSGSNCSFEDRTAWGTIATFASGAWSVSADWLGAVIAIK